MTVACSRGNGDDMMTYTRIRSTSSKVMDLIDDQHVGRHLPMRLKRNAIISNTPLRTVSIDDLKAYIDPQNRGFLECFGIESA